MSESHSEAVELPQTETEQIAAAAELLEQELFGDGENAVIEDTDDAVQEEPQQETAEAEDTGSTEASADVDSVGDDPADEPEPVAIDYDLEIPMPGGQPPIKLGELKDIAIQHHKSQVDLTERENAIMRERDQLRQLIQAAGGQVPEEVQKAMQQNMQQHLEREHRAMLEAIPDWSDQTVFKADRTAIVELGEQYGFSVEDISQISDHRAVKMMRDYSRLLQSRKANVEQIKQSAKPKPKPKTQNAKSAQQRRFDQARTGSLGQKVDAINELFAG